MFQITLKQLRERAGLSQAALGEKIGVRQSTIGMWESGKNVPDNVNRQKLANVFGVPVHQLMNNEKQDDYSKKFLRKLSEELETIDMSDFADVPEAVVDYRSLLSLSETDHPLSLQEACDAANKLGHSMSYMLPEIKEDFDSKSLESKKSPDSDITEPRDDIERELISFVKTMDFSQQSLLLAILKTAGAQNLKTLAAAQGSIDENTL